MKIQLRIFIASLPGLIFLIVMFGLIFKTLDKLFVSILLFLYFLIVTFVYRFQRTTLSISRSILGIGNPNIQSLLTPPWIGLLGWISQALWIIVAILLFFYFGWGFSLIFLSYVFLGVAFVDFISPLPSYNQCFKIIEKSLKKDINTTLDPNQKEALVSLLNEVERIKERYDIERK